MVNLLIKILHRLSLSLSLSPVTPSPQSFPLLSLSHSSVSPSPQSLSLSASLYLRPSLCLYLYLRLSPPSHSFYTSLLPPLPSHPAITMSPSPTLSPFLSGCFSPYASLFISFPPLSLPLSLNTCSK